MEVGLVIRLGNALPVWLSCKTLIWWFVGGGADVMLIHHFLRDRRACAEAPLPPRPTRLRRGQRVTEPEPSIPSWPATGVRPRTDPVHTVVGGPGGGAEADPGYLCLPVRR